MAETLTVSLRERSYPILICGRVEEKVREEVQRLQREGRRVVMVTDENVASAQEAALKTMAGDAAVFAVAAGEGAKSLAVLGNALEFLAEKGVDRRGAVFAVGGGVVGDLGGFAAASWLRGVDYYQVPTTLLAMVDSSVGGKTGINLPAGKNLVGAFHQPRAVFVGTDFLKTLPAREFAAGAAEVIKTGLLGDAELFGRLEAESLAPESPALAAVIRRCCELKARIVEADEREMASEGGRALLNLGHTFGHAIEQVTGYGAYLHGEAVAVGLAAAAKLSEKLGLIGAAEVARIERTIGAHALPVRLRAPLPVGDLLAAMGRDKKVRAGKLRFVVIERIGHAVTRGEVPTALAEACFREVGAA
jgi:3-dehydroquinate synthase